MSRDPDYDGPAMHGVDDELGFLPVSFPPVSYEEAIAAEHATQGRAVEPDFAELARSSPWAIDEWRSAWDVITKGFPSEHVETAWRLIRELSEKLYARPTSSALSLVALLNKGGDTDGAGRS